MVDVLVDISQKLKLQNKSVFSKLRTDKVGAAPKSKYLWGSFGVIENFATKLFRICERDMTMLGIIIFCPYLSIERKSFTRHMRFLGKLFNYAIF